MRLVAAAAGVRILLLGLVAVGPAVWLPQQYDASPQLWPGSEASNICQRFAVWDAVHLLHVAQGGYSQEHLLAFLPGYPWLVAALAPSDPSPCILVAVAVGISCAALVVATVLLYKLTLVYFQNQGIAERVVAMFLLSPAAVFFTAAYTESLFAACTFAALLARAHHYTVLSMTFWLAAAFVRANGTIAAGYPLFDAGLIILGSIVAWRTNHDRTVVLKAVLSALPHLLGAVVIVRLPWWLHSKTALIQFCPGDASYCAPTNAGGPWQVYSEVQQRYWNVGFLSYYTLHKAPNFALAAPLVIWSLAATRNMLPRLSSLIFKPMEFLRAPLLPFTVHNAALTIVALLFMHVEVTTRLLCTSTPMLYWYAASGGPPRFQSCLTLGLLYATLGSFAHHAYLPWT